ncbi:MAG: 3'-5' exonuclease [bacterium]
MLNEVKIEDVLFVDIETVPQYENYDLLPKKVVEFWEKKSAYFRKPHESAKDVYNRAGIYAEFGKIICISVAYIDYHEGNRYLKVQSFHGRIEKKILEDFWQFLAGFPREKNLKLCAHNGKEFDFPYIARRILLNGLKLPEILKVAGKKPWETYFIDTLELWKFGDYKHYTSLDLLSFLFNIPSPKNEIDGSMVAGIYYEDRDLDKIVKYCEKDVVAVVQLFLSFKGEPIFMTKEILHYIK